MPTGEPAPGTEPEEVARLELRLPARSNRCAGGQESAPRKGRSQPLCAPHGTERKVGCPCNKDRSRKASQGTESGGNSCLNPWQQLRERVHRPGLHPLVPPLGHLARPLQAALREAPRPSSSRLLEASASWDCADCRDLRRQRC